MTESTSAEQFTFQAEIKQLLHLLSHSLYQNREIALRELVSNASDALDKMRHLALTETEFQTDDALEIQILPHKDDRILEIQDNGIGMTRDELASNLGTIAHSGSREFLNRLSDQDSDEQANQNLSLIGQFGVGFYSAFMLAETVEVITRSCRESSGWRWESDGTGSFTIEPAEVDNVGTCIRLRLKADQDEFLDAAHLKDTLTKYSTFVPHPVILDGERVNDQRPIWVEPKSSLDEDQYHSFYHYLTHRAEETPNWYLHLSADSPFQFHAILYCPESNLESLGFGRTEHGLHLCAKRILVQNDCRELLPEYLRFLYGLVDSADLPLNVSREALQDNTVFRKMKKVLVRKVLDHLTQLSDDEDKYLTFYRQFGSILREGVVNDFEHRDKLAQLLRFGTSHAGNSDALTSLADYIERTSEDQKQIYFVHGPDLSAIQNNPGLEVFVKRGLEVLYLTDPADEFILSSLREFQDKAIISIDADDVDLPADSESSSSDSDKQPAEDSLPSGFNNLLSLLKEALTDQVEDVRKSDRLTDSPCCLVNPKGAMSTQLQQLLQQHDTNFEAPRRILEINPQAPLIQRLAELTANAQHIDFIKQCGRQLHAHARMLAGLPPDEDSLVERMQDFMQELAQQRSPIIT
jgi:molecular chaperone HtpG